MGSNHGLAGPASVDETIDTSKIWKTAVEQYERTSGVQIAALNSVNTIEDILNEVQTNENRFLRHRHSGSRSDRFRALLSQSLRPIERLLDVATQASKGASCLQLLLPATIRPAQPYCIKTTNV